MRVEAYLDRRAGVAHGLATHDAVGGLHGNGAHGVLTEMLGHLEHDALLMVLELRGGRGGARSAPARTGAGVGARKGSRFPHPREKKIVWKNQRARAR